MAKQRRVVRNPDVQASPPPATWPSPFVVFADLHAGGSSLAEACTVLAEVGALAEERNAKIVCLGDFWNLRGTLNVRQVDDVLREMERWKRECFFVPGNHDQVTLDGMVHGLNIFRPFPNVRVIDSPLVLPEWGVGFVPWRETDQAAAFAAVPAGMTIFGHGEVENALSNSGRQATGKVALGALEAYRSVYLGHYHKRQRLGSRQHVWYIGSPYQQNAGERDDPHGIAVVYPDREPEFVELHDLPKYWRFDMREPAGWDTSKVREVDIVEIVAPREMLGTAALTKSAAAVPARVRIKTEEPVENSAPANFALGLSDAIDQYVTETAVDLDVESARAYGRAILAEIPEARAHAPLGPVIDVVGLEIRDFCAVRGSVTVPIADVDFTLLRGPVRSGKTAVVDAVSWCLYGQTSPRKPGQAGATFRGDDVIHDAASSCSVEVALRIGGKDIRIKREKARGKGAKVSGFGALDGIADQQALIEQSLGLPYALWRACVSVGQGAVANFATDADKRRKELLEAAFDLEACPKAQVVARQRQRDAQVEVDSLVRQREVAEGQLQVLSGQDFSAQIKQWDDQRAAALEALKTRGNELRAARDKAATVLDGEAQWLATREACEKQIEALTAMLAGASLSGRIAELQRQYGAIEAEGAIVHRDLGAVKKKLEQAVSAASAGGQLTCRECGQPLPKGNAEAHLQALEAEVRAKEFEVRTLQSRAGNVMVELDDLNNRSSAETEGTKAQLAEARKVQQQCGEALGQFARVRANMEGIDGQLEALRKQYKDQAAALNPFTAQAEQTKRTIVELEGRVAALESEAENARGKLRLAEFWADGFGPKGIPVLVLRTVIYDLESAANRHLSALLDGTLLCRLQMVDEDLRIVYLETDETGETRERSYEQLSGGQRRCAELSFCPLGLSDVIFARRGVRVPLLVIDELTTHLGEEQKQRACEEFVATGRKVLVVDHDAAVQGHFDHVWTLLRKPTGTEVVVR